MNINEGADEKKTQISQLLLQQLKKKHVIQKQQQGKDQETLLKEQQDLKEQDNKNPWKNNEFAEKLVEKKDNKKDKNSSEKPSKQQSNVGLGLENQSFNQEAMMQQDYSDVINSIATNFAQIVNGLSNQIAKSVGTSLKQEFKKHRTYMSQMQREQEENSKKRQYQMDAKAKFIKNKNITPPQQPQQDDKNPYSFEDQGFDQTENNAQGTRKNNQNYNQLNQQQQMTNKQNQRDQQQPFQQNKYNKQQDEDIAKLLVPMNTFQQRNNDSDIANMLISRKKSDEDNNYQNKYNNNQFNNNYENNPFFQDRNQQNKNNLNNNNFEEFKNSVPSEAANIKFSSGQNNYNFDKNDLNQQQQKYYKDSLPIQFKQIESIYPTVISQNDQQPEKQQFQTSKNAYQQLFQSENQNIKKNSFADQIPVKYQDTDNEGFKHIKQPINGNNQIKQNNNININTNSQVISNDSIKTPQYGVINNKTSAQISNESQLSKFNKSAKSNNKDESNYEKEYENEGFEDDENLFESVQDLLP